MKNKYVIIRSEGSGVFAGTLVEENSAERWVELENARRLWYWVGAASLSELAMRGVANKTESKFPQEVDNIKIFNILEIIEATKEAEDNIKSVPIWGKH